MKIANPLTSLKKLRQHRFFHDGWVVGLLFTAALANLATIVWSVTHIRHSDYFVPVRYTSLLNFDRIGNWYELYSIPVLSVIILFTNLYLAIVGYKRSRMVSIFLILSALMIAILGLVIIRGLTSINYGTT